MKGLVCPVPWQHCEVGHDHCVYLCCHLPTSVGSLVGREVIDVWWSPTAVRIRQDILVGDYKYCRRSTCPILEQPIVPTADWWRHTMALRPLEPAEMMPYPRAPLRLSLSNERSCNLACTSCRKTHYRGSDPRLATVLSSVRRSLPAADVLKLCGSGEFSLSEELCQFASQALREHPRLRLELLTNLTTFGARELEALGWRGRVSQICGSLDASTPETYAKVRGGNFKVVKSNLLSLQEIKDSDHIDLVAIFVVSAVNFREMPDVALEMRDLGVKVNFLRVQDWGHLSREEFADLDVGSPSHPLHDELLDVMTSPHLRAEHVRLGDLLKLLPAK
ncbi:MAG TPA: hypothetical protein VMS77_09435 [Conexivisphaerales archaeon]|nr:hypothetical protein [Conexivisphaerales archaeon]